MNVSPTWTKRFSRIAFAATVAVAVGTLSACSADSINGPTPAIERNNGLIDDVSGLLKTTLKDINTAVKGLLRPKSIAAVTRSLKVTRSAGGTIRIPEAGFTLTIPAGAIRTDTLTITVTALAGKAMAYEFGPHGTTFAKPLTFTQDLDLTQVLAYSTLAKLTGGLSGAYFKDKSQVNTTTGVAVANELLTATLLSNKVSFGISHFSGYMIATGRSASADASDASPE